MTPTLSVRPGVSATRHPQRGLSLIELMIALAIGMLIMAALGALMLSITRNNSELAKANAQIENGRFAIQLLQNDLVHAGFWGELSPAAATAVLADPCQDPATPWDAAYKANMLGIPVQGYSSATVPASCATGALAAGDVLIVRHANTCTAGSANCDGGTDIGPHIQVSGCTAISEPAAYRIAEAASADLVLRKKNCTTTAERRKVVTNIYYLATSNDQPTLMRVSLANGAYQAAEPLIEGIEALRFEYGIDSTGDGSPDGSYVSTPPTTLPDMGNIVAVKIHVLARNLEATPGYTDSKAYKLGATSYTVPTADAGFKRHVFSTTVRLVNPSGRREVP